jgi:hypothetical protein
MVQQIDQIESLKERKHETEFLTNLVRGSWVVLFICIIYQLIFFAEITNVIAMSSVVLAWLLCTKIWLRKEMLETYLISTFMIIGFVATQFYFPLLFITIENKPLVYNLELPEQVFLHSTLALFVIVIAHAIYRFLMKASPDRSFSFLEKAGFFDPPNHLQVWIIGAVGMASSFYVYFTAPEIGREVTGAASDKLVQALVPLMYAPFFIPLAKLYGNFKKPHRGYTLMIVLYAALLLAIGIGRNSRAAFILGLTTPAYAYGLGLILGVFKTKILTVKNVVIGVLVIWFLTGPLSDLGTAMLIVRGNRTEISAMELISETVDALGDKEAIESRKKADKTETIDYDWDEHYLDNIYTARYANIKFNDSNLVTYSRVGELDPDMRDYTIDQLIVALPDPVIKMFNFDVDKELVLSLSFGDYLYVLSGGVGTPTSFRVGHMAGSGMAAFGWSYLLLFGLIIIPGFYLNDKFFRKKPASSIDEDSGLKYQFSFCGILALTTFFGFLILESVVQGATYCMRSWPQMVVLYFIVFHMSRIMSSIVTGRKRHARLSPT